MHGRRRNRWCRHAITWSRFCRQIHYILTSVCTHAFDIWSSNRYRTQECNVIHAMSVKTGPTKLTALKLTLSSRVWINTPLSNFLLVCSLGRKNQELFIHNEWDSQGIIACGLRPTKQIWRPAKCREIEEGFWSKTRNFEAHIALSTTF